MNTNDNSVIAFTGYTQKGKSTIAFALGQKEGWIQISDESLAFISDNHKIEIINIPNYINLREPTKKHFNKKSSNYRPISWPEKINSLKCIYFLETGNTVDFKLVELNKANAYKQILQQAFALTIRIKDKNQKLMNDYMDLICSDTKFFRLEFRKDFSKLDHIAEKIKKHSRNIA